MTPACPPNDPLSVLTRLRERQPLVQCITNAVVTNMTANVLLAAGASPAMVDIPGEAGLFAGLADGLLINLGTPHAEQREAMIEAAPAARAWVLDPVAVGALPVRTRLAHDLVEHRPAIIRGNASEILALAGQGAGGRGVDSTDTSDSALEAARDLARGSGAVVAVSGETDVITDGERTVRVRGGSAMLTRITGAGCSLGAVMAAMLAVSEPLDAAVAASALFAQASEAAEKASSGPGTFAAAFIDALSSADAFTLTIEEDR